MWSILENEINIDSNINVTYFNVVLSLHHEDASYLFERKYLEIVEIFAKLSRINVGGNS